MARSNLLGPELGPKWDIVGSIPDLTGKVAIVTGANSPSGLGYNVALQLAVKGAKVYVGARSLKKAEDAIAEMRKSTPQMNAGLLHPLAIDLSDLKSVQAAARSFLESESRLDILNHNAAVLAGPLHKDSHGISVSIVTNHLGPMLFTMELMPLLKKTSETHPGVRVVTVSSAVHALLPTGIKFSSKDDFNNPLGGTDDFNSNLQRYAFSKLTNVLFTKELNRRLVAEDMNAIAITLHPGGVKTDGAIKFVGSNIEMLDEALSPTDGALTSLFAATNPAIWQEKDKYGGAYLTPFGVIQSASLDAENLVLAKELWLTSEKVIREVLDQ